MTAPETTPEARQAIATALAVLVKHKISAFRTTQEGWPEAHQGIWVLPIGSAHENTQAFRPFWMNKGEVLCYQAPAVAA
ncbi:MAG: hypothetical protein PHE17_14935 [Thiothrix sp.]|uniref:hypothetical protein n=1 Tax=Thiothrix sp. TaxID=1032 RepID=UPI00262DD4E2|nr:hypothetical protein [Thiothrix sp.]MDD5394307.1 hypothetical protein [Thiothrix sp.]